VSAAPYVVRLITTSHVRDSPGSPSKRSPQPRTSRIDATAPSFVYYAGWGKCLSWIMMVWRRDDGTET